MKANRIYYRTIVCVALLVALALTMTGCLSLNFSAQSGNSLSSAVSEEETPAYEQKLAEIMALIDKYYVDDYDENALGDYLANAAVAATGDRWSYYISAEDYAAHVESNNNAYVGVGITIELTNEDDPGFTITDVTRGGPAEKAGIQTGDMIVAVEGQNAVALGMDETKNLVRGEEGTEVTITILRDGAEQNFTITRSMIEVDVVVYEKLSTGEGYIKINNFDARCAQEAIAAIEALQAQDVTALIFDLRFNPGGRLTELVELLDYLLPEGPLFRSVDYSGKEEVEYSDADCIDLPMAVLVNGDSYSAAEFFAAALQEYDAAVIVGTQTCGKANYQQTFRLSDGSAIAISTGHYQTPNGVTLAGVGVTPDVIVEVDDETYVQIYYEKLEKADDAQLQAAVAALWES